VTLITNAVAFGRKKEFMLETIRKSTKSTYILLLFGAIILVFIFWGIGPGGRGRSVNAVAVVNGEPISIKDYLALHKRLTDYYRKVLKDRYTPSVEKGLNLKKNAVAILIDRELAVGAANDMGITVSKKDVQGAIGSVEAFQKDGVFDKDTYFNSLRAQRIKPSDFEEDVKRDLLVEKVRAAVIKDIKVTDDDIKKDFLKENREINLSYVAIKASKKKASIKVSDEDGRKYLMDHSTDFVIPAKVKVVYAFADYASFARLSGISDKEIKEYYDQHMDRFTEPEKIEARHILIRPDMKNKDQEGAKKAARKKAGEILERIKAGENFATLARKYSGDPGSAKKGGSLGWFPRGVMMKSFEDAAFALKTGEISGIVETPFGFHIIKLEGRKPAVVKPLSRAGAEIRKALAGELSRERALKAVKDLTDPFKKASSIDEMKEAVKKTKGVTFRGTGLFDAKHFDDTLAGVRRIKDSLFLMNEGEVSEPVKTYRGVYLVKVVKRVEARIPEYDEVKKDVIDTLRESKAERAAKKEAKEVLKALKDGGKLRDVARKKGLKVSTTGFFSMNDGFIPGMGLPVQSYGDIFDLGAKKPLYDKPLSSSGNYYIALWKASKEADLKGLTPKLRESLSTRLKSEKEEAAINKWLSSLRKKAEIQVFEDRM